MSALNESINQSKLHFGESILYQIHKRALTEYLSGGEIDQRIISMNLLKISTLSHDELLLLQRAFTTKNQNSALQEEASKVLRKFRPKRRSSNFSYYFQGNRFSQEEQDMLNLEERLKIVLKSKLNTQKLFNGTYLVDPSIEDLRKRDLKNGKGSFDAQFPKLQEEGSPLAGKLQDRLKRQSSKLKLPQVQQSKAVLKNCDKQEVMQILEQVGNKSEVTLKNLREKYKEVETDEEQRKFFRYVKNGDAVNLNQQFLNGELPLSVVNQPNEKGYYAIHLAIIQGDAQLFKLLVKFNADLAVLTKTGKSIKHLVSVYQNEEIAGMIRQIELKEKL